MKYLCLMDIILNSVVYHFRTLQKVQCFKSAIKIKGNLPEIQDAVNIGAGRIIQ